MLFLIDVIDDEVDPTDAEPVILQSGLIVNVKKNAQFDENSIILYKENRRLVEYEIPMTVKQFWKYLKNYSMNDLLQ